MKKIEIKIPDNLSEQEEVIAIYKKLAQKSLSGSARNREQKRIGAEVNIIELQTQITITRVSTEKAIEMVKCNVCGCEYQNDTAVFYWHNYGGSPKKIAVCSDTCKNTIISFLGHRAARSRYKLTSLNFVNHNQ